MLLIFIVRIGQAGFREAIQDAKRMLGQTDKTTPGQTHETQTTPFFIDTLCGTQASRRIGVIRTRPTRSAPIARVIIDQPNYCTVCPTNHAEASRSNNEQAPADHEPPSPISVLLLRRPVVIQPHAAHRLEADECAEQCSDERYQAIEARDGAGDDVCCDYDSKST